MSVEQSESVKRRGTVCVCVHVRGESLESYRCHHLAAEQVGLNREKGRNQVYLWRTTYDGMGKMECRREEQAKVKEDREGSHRCQNYQYQNQSMACGRVELAPNPKLGNIAVLLRNTARNVLAYAPT